MNKERLNVLFSIIIPVYNGAKYVCEAIESVLNQKGIDRSDYEIIVVNDGSTDNGDTEKAIAFYLPEITYLDKPNGGVSSALNHGIQVARGEYICWLSHDDLFLPEKLHRQKQLIENNSDGVVIFGQQNFIDANGNLIWKHKYNHFYEDSCVILSRREILNGLLKRINFSGCSVAIPRSFFGGRFGAFNEDMRYVQDVEMWFRLALADYSFLVDNKIVVSSRVHPDQQTGKRLDRYYKESRSLNGFLIGSKVFRDFLDGNILHLIRFYIRLAESNDKKSAFGMNDLTILYGKGKKFVLYSVFGAGLVRRFALHIYRKVITQIYRG